MNLGYQYFSGANVIIEVEGIPLLETCGIRLSIAESKRPIYGYSSRHFDAVANGQVLVEGALLVNYVDHNYLFKAIEMALQRLGAVLGDGDVPPAQDLSTDLRDQLAKEGNALSLLNQSMLDPVGTPGIAEALKSRYWRPMANSPAARRNYVLNPHDVFGGLDVRVTFGDREAYNFYRGLTSMLIQTVHFTGRGTQIAVDEQTIVEEYPFFARNIVHEVQPYTLDYNADDQEITILTEGKLDATDVISP